MNAAPLLQASPEASPSVRPPEPEKASILIVDDRPDKALALEVALEPLHEKIVRVHSGDDALRRLLQQDFAVILLDVKMPGMDGFETAALIRQRQRSETTPIIFVSAVNDPETHISRGYSLGAVDYILAPVEPEILRAKVSVFVDLFHKTAQIRRQAEERTQRIRAEAARAEAEKAKERAAFLAEASNVLAGSLDWEVLCSALVRLAVPKLADGCVVDLVAEEGAAPPATVAHVDPGMEEAIREYHLQFPIDAKVADENAGAPSRSEVCQDMTETCIQALAGDEEQANALRAIGMTGYARISLNARGRVLGALTLLNTTKRRISSKDLSLGEELADRAALALDNAALYKAAQKARMEAEHANQAKDQFLAMLSHELRTPLTPVLNAIALLESDETCPEGLHQSLRMIQRNVALEARLIDDLLDLTRISKGKLQLNLDTVDAHPLLESALEICRGEIAEKRIEVSAKLEATEHFLRADSARIQQVFWNLIKNSVKFTPPEGGIRIRTHNNEEGQFCVEISDTGIGINAQLLPRVFDAFEQGAKTAQSGKGGLGLGLAITKALVDLHGGCINAVSEGTNRGSTFLVCFPVVSPSHEASSGGPEAEPPVAERHALRLLLVEDHPDTIHSLNRLLVKRGYEVRVASTLEAAIQTAHDYPFDVLVSDMGLPDGTGLDLMRHLSKTGPVKGVALSGYGMEDDIQRSKAAGFSDHLTKPIDINKLDRALQNLAKDREPVGA